MMLACMHVDLHKPLVDKPNMDRVVVPTHNYGARDFYQMSDVPLRVCWNSVAAAT